jgi:hypothetical protein
MIKFKKEYLPYLWASLGILGFIFCMFKACENINELPITSKEAIIAEYQKQMLQDKVDTLKIYETQYVDRWHDAKVITKEVFKEVYRDAPDTCKTYIAKIELAVEGEQKAAQVVHESDSLIIANLEAVVKVNSLLIAKAKQDLKFTQDTLSKNRKPKPLKKALTTIKHVGIGVTIGAAIVKGYQFFKNIM